MKTLAIDFDDTIAEKGEEWPDIGLPKPGAVEAIRALKAAGYEIVIHSCRTSRGEFLARDVAQHATAIRAFMAANKIPFDHIWMEEGKPIAWAYIDDRGVRYEGDADAWTSIAYRLIDGDLAAKEIVARKAGLPRA